MPDILVRDLPDDVHAGLKQRAAEDGTSLQTYVSRLLREHVERPSPDEWLRRVRALAAAVDGTSGADAVRDARDERDALLAERLDRPRATE